LASAQDRRDWWPLEVGDIAVFEAAGSAIPVVHRIVEVRGVGLMCHDSLERGGEGGVGVTLFYVLCAARLSLSPFIDLVECFRERDFDVVCAVRRQLREQALSPRRLRSYERSGKAPPLLVLTKGDNNPDNDAGFLYGDAKKGWANYARLGGVCHGEGSGALARACLHR